MQEESAYKYFHWGPLLFKTQVSQRDLKKFNKLCTKKSSPVNDTLAGVIKHEHYISTHDYYKIAAPYLMSFRHCYKQWYGEPLHKRIVTVMAWVNFMRPGEFNPPHVHQNCDFSSVLYIKIPQKLKEENKKFKGTGGGPGSISFVHGEVQRFSPNSQYFFPKEGNLFIFPASLTHFVNPFMSSDERISMGANFKIE